MLLFILAPTRNILLLLNRLQLFDGPVLFASLLNLFRTGKLERRPVTHLEKTQEIYLHSNIYQYYFRTERLSHQSF